MKPAALVQQARAKFMVRSPSPSSQRLPWEDTTAQELFLGTAYTGSGCRSCESTAVEGTGAPLHLDFLQMGEETEGAAQC